MNVFLETLFVRLKAGSVLYLRDYKDISRERSSPDALVRVAALQRLRAQTQNNTAQQAKPSAPAQCREGDDALPKDTVIHSTSWRYEDSSAGAGAVVLTYIVYCPEIDATGFSAMDFKEMQVARGAADRPRPENLQIGEVLSHSVRHLAFLFRTDPEVHAALLHEAGAQDAFALVEERLAGVISAHGM